MNNVNFSSTNVKLAIGHTSNEYAWQWPLFKIDGYNGTLNLVLENIYFATYYNSIVKSYLGLGSSSSDYLTTFTPTSVIYIYQNNRPSSGNIRMQFYAA